jgi:hypothetical protein
MHLEDDEQPLAVFWSLLQLIDVLVYLMMKMFYFYFAG